MPANDSWTYQGRKEHGWFGDGTKPESGDDGPELFAPRNAGERVDYAARTVIAGLSRKDRQHPAATFSKLGLARLPNVVLASYGASGLSRDAFRQHFFNPYTSDAAVDQWREAAKALVEARTPQALSAASAQLTQAIQAIGLSRWPQHLREMKPPCRQWMTARRRAWSGSWRGRTTSSSLP